MTESEIEMINIIQQVLRALTVTLAASQQADLGKLGAALESAAGHQALEPMARQMLADLAGGLLLLDSAGKRKQ